MENSRVINWYPGHMAKAKREVEDKIKLVDIVLELIDARIPVSSRNPMIDQILKNKPRLILMTKASLGDSYQNAKWERYFQSHGQNVLLIDAISGFNIKKIVPVIKEILSEKLLRDKTRGLKERAIKCMIVGIPNVGKSTLINTLVKKKATITGDRPGVTKAQQWVRINKDLELLDTPGVLWPKFDDQRIGYDLAITGAIKDEITAKDNLIMYLIDFLKKNYPSALVEKYQVSLEDDFTTILDKIGRNRGFFIGREVDYEKVYISILNDFRNIRLGRISLNLI